MPVPPFHLPMTAPARQGGAAGGCLPRHNDVVSSRIGLIMPQAGPFTVSPHWENTA
jgi:hypothetical protein